MFDMQHDLKVGKEEVVRLVNKKENLNFDDD
jgi:hypothetical protein